MSILTCRIRLSGHIIRGGQLIAGPVSGAWGGGLLPLPIDFRPYIATHGVILSKPSPWEDGEIPKGILLLHRQAAPRGMTGQFGRYPGFRALTYQIGGAGGERISGFPIRPNLGFVQYVLICNRILEQSDESVSGYRFFLANQYSFC